MPDRAWLFLGSVVLIIASLAWSVYLFVTGSVWGLDGLFMLLVLLTTALCFALYAWDLIGQTRDEIEKERAPKPAAKKAPAPKAQES